MGVKFDEIELETPGVAEFVGLIGFVESGRAGVRIMHNARGEDGMPLSAEEFRSVLNRRRRKLAQDRRKAKLDGRAEKRDT